MVGATTVQVVVVKLEQDWSGFSAPSTATTTASLPRSGPPSTAAEGVAAFFSPQNYYSWPPNYSSSSAAMMYQQAAAAAALSCWPSDVTNGGHTRTNTQSTNSSNYWPIGNTNSGLNTSGSGLVSSQLCNSSESPATSAEPSAELCAAGSSSSLPLERRSPEGNGNDPQNAAKHLYGGASLLNYPNNYMKSMLGAAAQWANDAASWVLF